MHASTRFLLSFLLAFIIFFPSLQIAHTVIFDFDFKLKEKLEPGEPLIINEIGEFFWLSKDGTPFSLLPTGHGFASTGIGHRPHITISGHLKTKNISRLNFLKNPRVQFVKKIIPINYPPIETAGRLRIPKEIWQKQQSADEEQRQQERELMREILGQINANIDLSCWQKPLKSRVTSLFGSPRSLPDGRRYYHSGTDYRAPTGTPIPSAGRGVVAYAGHMIVPGNVVVLDHGGGLYSRYAHLSKISVNVGELVEKGTLLGLAGATGRVEAPHLHWEVIWKGNHANPEMFLQAWEQICDPG